MRRVGITALTVLLFALASCGGQSASVGSHGSPRSSPAIPAPSATATSSSAPQRESAPTIKHCKALQEYPLSLRADVPNPCAQATRLVALYRDNETYHEKGFLVKVGRLEPAGIELLVSGDAAAAKQELGDDPLVVSIHTVEQGW